MADRSLPVGIRFTVLAALIAAVVAGGFVALMPRAAAATSVFTVYMAPTGSDANSGLSAGSPVYTLNRVQQVLTHAKPSGDVEVRIKQGQYVSPPVPNWNFYVPGHTISFLPVGYTPGHPTARPVFVSARNTNGTYQGGTWFTANVPTDKSAPLYHGGTAGLKFYDLDVQHYNDGLSLDGDYGHPYQVQQKPPLPPFRMQSTAGLNGNTVQDTLFEDIGTKWTSGNYGFGAILLTNSSHNQIVNDGFQHVENTGSVVHGVHGLYITHFSSYNTIKNNTFTFNSSDPVKLRDRSNDNNIQGNKFSTSGWHSFYRDEFCDTSCATANKKAEECASFTNRFADNHMLSAYDGNKTLPGWTLSPAGNAYPGNAPCTLPQGVTYRLQTAGNIRT